MKNWKIVLSAGAVAAGAAMVLLSRKSKDSAVEQPASVPAAAKKAAPKNMTEGLYSFVSGYKDAATVNVKVPYDKDRFEFVISEGDFLTYTSDSHVAIMNGVDFNAQIEYVPYYPGDDFGKLVAGAKEKYNSFKELSRGFRYIDGDSVCVCLPADDSSYLLINALLCKGSSLKFEELPDAPELLALVDGITIE